jgi:hypothetical protein
MYSAVCLSFGKLSCLTYNKLSKKRYSTNVNHCYKNKLNK